MKLWLWKNGPHEFWAFDNLYPCYPDGDPMTLGEPVGYAIIVKQSVNGRPDKMEEPVSVQQPDITVRNGLESEQNAGEIGYKHE